MKTNKRIVGGDGFIGSFILIYQIFNTHDKESLRTTKFKNFNNQILEIKIKIIVNF